MGNSILSWLSRCRDSSCCVPVIAILPFLRKCKNVIVLATPPPFPMFSDHFFISPFSWHSAPPLSPRSATSPHFSFIFLYPPPSPPSSPQLFGPSSHASFDKRPVPLRLGSLLVYIPGLPAPLIWAAKLQTVVVEIPTTESECVALFKACLTIIHIRHLLKS